MHCVSLLTASVRSVTLWDDGVSADLRPSQTVPTHQLYRYMNATVGLNRIFTITVCSYPVS